MGVLVPLVRKNSQSQTFSPRVKSSTTSSCNGLRVCTMSDEEYYEEEEVTSQTSKKVEGMHQRMAQTTWQRGGRIEEAQGKTSQAQGDQSRAREKIGPTKEGRGREAPQGRGRKEGQGG